MRPDKRDLAGGAVVLLMAVASVVLYPRLPEEMAVHFSAAGRPDSYLPKPLAVAMLPAVAALVVATFRVIPAVDPLGGNIEGFRRYYDFLAVFVTGVLAYAHGLVLAYNLGYRFDVTVVVVPLLAVTYVVAGYVIENADQNWFVGVRTPWTLSDEEVWDRTHERTGVLFKIAGLVTLLAVPFPQYFEVLAIGPVAVAALVATAYSFVVYRRKRRGTEEAG
jgi:uncharacterized membrane protein